MSYEIVFITLEMLFLDRHISIHIIYLDLRHSCRSILVLTIHLVMLTNIPVTLLLLFKYINVLNQYRTCSCLGYIPLFDGHFMRASIEAWNEVTLCQILATSLNTTLWYRNCNAAWCITGGTVWLIGRGWSFWGKHTWGEHFGNVSQRGQWTRTRTTTSFPIFMTMSSDLDIIISTDEAEQYGCRNSQQGL